MLSVFYMFEAIFYSLVNFLPYLLLALFPFRDSLRFSKKNTAALIVLLTLCQIGIGIWVILFDPPYKGFLSIFSTLIYGIFYCFCIKEHMGKAFLFQM